MAKPEQGSRSCWCVCVALAVVGTLILASTAMTYVLLRDAQRRDHLNVMEDQLDSLRHLVNDLQRRLDLINSTVHAETKDNTQEVVYEDEGEYEYDDEEVSSYEYEDEDDNPSPKATVKRTPVLSERTNLTEVARSRRDIAAVREDRYVPSTPLLNNVINSLRGKSPRLQKYSTYFSEPKNYVSFSDQEPQRLNYFSQLHSQEGADQPTDEETFPRHKNSHIQSPTYQEQRRPEESHVRLRHGGRHRNGQVRDVEFISQHSPEVFERPPTDSEHHCQLLAAHYVGDSSAYNIRDHSHYFGNNILYHPHGIFKDWVPSDWMFDLGVNSHFPYLDGKLSIQKPGIYFVYAQIYYAATHDRCGFHIKRNGEEIAQCTITSSGRMVKRNTCFTAVITQLQTSDLLWTSEVEGHRNTSFKSAHSFFGLVMLKPT